jgi:O-antigen ligase
LTYVGSISYFSGTALSLPFLFRLVFNQKKTKNVIIYILCIGVIILSLIFSTMLASLLLTIISFIAISLLSLKYNFHKTRVVIIYFSIKFLFMIISMRIRNIVSLDYLFGKSEIITSTAFHGGITHVPRGSDAILSIKAFIKSPLVGIGPMPRGFYYETGEHSTWLDGLAEFGILGFAPFIGFLYYGFRRVYKAFRAEPNNYFQQARIVAYFIYLIHGLINPWGFDGYSAVFFAALVMSPK